MGWIQNHLRNRTQEPGQSETNSESYFQEAAKRRWQQLGEELKSDLAEFRSHQKDAALDHTGANEFRISNSDSGLELLVTADFEAHIIRYRYSALNSKSTGAPEGGMLSMRQSRQGLAEFYSADERLTSEEARQVLLEPVLFPPQKAA